MIIKPYSVVGEEAFSATNYPSCKLFFTCDDTDNNLTDAVSGSSIATGVAITHGTANAVTVPSGVNFINKTLPASIAVGTKSALMFVVASGIGSFEQIAFGDVGVGKLLISGSAFSVDDGPNAANTAGVSGTGLIGCGLGFVPGTSNEATKYEATTATWVTASASGAPADITNIGNITQLATVAATTNTLNIYGMALFVFDSGLPGDIKAAIAWMTAEWQAGNKAIYPGWKGLA